MNKAACTFLDLLQTFCEDIGTGKYTIKLKQEYNQCLQMEVIQRMRERAWCIEVSVSGE